MVHEPHDALFKATFSSLEAAAEEFRAVLPAALANALDWSTLALESGSFIEDALKKRFSDLLFSVSPVGAPSHRVLLYLLFEHQSQPRELMAFRLLRYEVDIWSGYLAEHEGARRLPAIIPLVLYHGERAWQVPRNLRALIDVEALEAPVRAEIERYLPAFEYLLDDLSVVPDQALKQRPMSAASRLVLGALKRGRAGDWKGLLVDWPEVMEEVLGGIDGLQRVTQVLLYLMSVNRVSPEEIETFLKEHVMSENIEETFLSTADQLILRGKVAKGREMLCKLLERRFGMLPAEVVARIEQAEPAQVDRWIEEVVVAGSLDEVFQA